MLKPKIQSLMLLLFGIKKKRGKDCKPTGVQQTTISISYIKRFPYNDAHKANATQTTIVN